MQWIRYAEEMEKSILPNDRPIILMYHSISEQPPDYDAFDLRVGAGNFCDHMKIISRNRTPLPLVEFVDLLDRGDLPTDAVAITCDDGYADNLLIAKSILDRFAIPATIFLATGSLGTTEFWWDRLERVICEAGSLPTEVNLNVNHSVTVPLGGSRTNALLRIYQHLRDLEPRIRDAVIDELAKSLRSTRMINPSGPLTEDEVRTLATGATVIGAHTVNHPWLPRLTSVELTRELVDSKRHCERLVGDVVCCFAYPFGAYDSNSRAAVLAAGFKLACSTIEVPVLADCDRFTLPRIHIKNWDADEFARRICPSHGRNERRSSRTNGRQSEQTWSRPAPPVPRRTGYPNPLFDAQWYLAQNPDVRESSFDPYDHFMRYGASEGRNPNAFFDTSWYLANNPDVRASGMNPLDHYLHYGAAEGRKPSPTSDLPSNINPFFDAQWYLAQYPDVRESSFDPSNHFVSYGAAQGRNPNSFFDTSWYLEHNPDVRESGMNPLEHYLHYGAAEGRKPGPLNSERSNSRS
jgi:peptidoglycan/xylan/chitin deacetylase (PgdA/CDA1 family)